jgi:DNA-directed RNA polymerase specialized sigma24 family protein
MADERDSPDDLYPFAQMLVRKLIKKHGLKWDEHRIEDSEQELFLAGWQVYQDEGDVGLAKNRMKTRTANLVRDYSSERKHEPKAASDQFQSPGIDKSGRLWDDDAIRDWDTSSSFSGMGDDPADVAIYRELLEGLPERQRKIVLLRSAGHTDQEIASELGLSLRTVERELFQFRKERMDDCN